jgi:hypothetical protein
VPQTPVLTNDSMMVTLPATNADLFFQLQLF